MTYDDAIWSYAEEFSDDLLRGISDKSVEPVLEEITETMSYELNKRDRRKVLEKMETLMWLNVSEGRIDKTAWEKIRYILASFVGA